MGVLLGYDYFASIPEDDSVSLTNVKNTEYSAAIIDEISLRSKTDQGMTNIRNGWENDSAYLSKFINTLESGNLANDGVKIVKFRIVRRLADQSQSEDIQMGEVSFTAGTNAELSFTDSTQPNQKLIYTIIPVGENGLDGQFKEVTVDSSDSFTGWWVVDKDTGNVLPFDSAIGSVGNVDGQLNQDRIMLETFNKYAQVYYGEKEYHSFSLTTTIVPKDLEKSGNLYLDILTKFIKQHKPFIIKAENGMVYVADIGNTRFSSPLNTWNGFDPLTITIDCTEVQDYEEFMKGE